MQGSVRVAQTRRHSASAFRRRGIVTGVPRGRNNLALRDWSVPKRADQEEFEPLRCHTGSSTMNPNKALWEKGDFTRLAQSMRKSGESLVKELGITKGLKVLDLGCGDGTTALPEAVHGADVLGVDIASNLVAAGNKRASDAGLANCKFLLGDACDLQELTDNAFD